MAGRRRYRAAAMVASVLVLGACTDTADVFPLNDAAKRLGPLKASFVRTGMGRGHGIFRVEVSVRDRHRRRACAVRGTRTENRTPVQRREHAGGTR